MSELSDGMVEATLELINKMFYNGEKISFYSVANKGKVSRQFLYNHKEIVDRISYLRNFNSLAVEEKFLLLKADNQDLLNRVEAYEKHILDFYIKHSN